MFGMHGKMVLFGASESVFIATYLYDTGVCITVFEGRFIRCLQYIKLRVERKLGMPELRDLERLLDSDGRRTQPHKARDVSSGFSTGGSSVA